MVAGPTTTSYLNNQLIGQSFFSNVVTRKGVIRFKTVGDAQLVGDNLKGCIMINFIPLEKGYNFNLKVIQPLVPHHVRRRQWTTRFGVVLNCNITYFEKH